MATKYETLIRSFCEANAIQIPPGFGRNTPGRYSIIRLDGAHPKLVATTWAKTSDVVYYIEHLFHPVPSNSISEHIRILDFKNGTEYSYNGGKQLNNIGHFLLTSDSA